MILSIRRETERNSFWYKLGELRGLPFDINSVEAAETFVSRITLFILSYLNSYLIKISEYSLILRVARYKGDHQKREAEAHDDEYYACSLAGVHKRQSIS